jgi:hypothetical protein
MILNRKKILPLAFFILTLISIILMAASFWNIIDKAHISHVVFLVLFFFIALISASLSYILFLKDTDSSILEDAVNLKLKEERAKIYDELAKKEEVVDEAKIDLDEIVNRIIPKGNFKNIDSFALKLFQNLGSEIEISQGILYLSNKDFTKYKFVAGYALTNEKPVPDFKPGENLNGQVVVNKEVMVITDIPQEYMNIESGLGKGKAVNLFIAPVLFENNTVAVLEFATFKSNSDFIKEVIIKVNDQIADKLIQIQKS